MSDFVTLFKTAKWPAFTAAVLWLSATFLACTPIPGFDIETIGIACALMIVAIGLIWRSPHPKTLFHYVKLRPVTWPVVGAFGLSLLVLSSVFTSEIPWVSATMFWLFALFPLSMIFMLMADHDTRALTLSGLLGVSGLLAIISLTQYYFFRDPLVFGRASWPLNDPNSLATLYALSFFANFYASLKFPHQKATCLLMILCAAALATTGSRGASFGLILMMVPLLVCLRARLTRPAIIALAISLGVFLLVNFANKSEGNTAIGNTIAVIEGEKPALWNRPLIWEASWNMIKAHPYLGTGYGTFSFFYGSERLPEETSAGYTAHNDILHLWAELGFLGPLLWLFIGGTIVYVAWRSLRKKHVNIMLNLTTFCAFGAFALQGLIAAVFFVGPTLCVLGAWLGNWARHDKETGKQLEIEGEEDTAHDELITREPAHPALRFLMTVAALSVVIPPFLSTYILDGNNRFFGLGTYERAELASKISLTLEGRAYLNMAASKLAALPATPTTDQLISIYKDIDRALDRNLKLARAPYLLAHVIRRDPAFEGNRKEASINALEKAIAIQKVYLIARLELMQELVRSEDWRKAYTLVQEDLKWKFRGPQALKSTYYNLEREVILRMGTLKELAIIEEKEKALE
ncbi:MAG: O-antigen ligase family protein [Pseudobdellovibrionaceae bacterium]